MEEATQHGNLSLHPSRVRLFWPMEGSYLTSVEVETLVTQRQ